jgi:hypothetical protein
MQRIQGELPDLDGATDWLNSEPLEPADLRGTVVLVQFCTYSCVNWLRTLPYVRAWAERYRDQGLVVIGAHSPEFGFEHDVDAVHRATRAMGIDYPLAIDNDFAVWRAFDNHYWPALYFADAQGRIRHHHFGEEDYERSERVIQELLREAGHPGAERKLVALVPDGVEAAADWTTLGSPEKYIGYARTEGFASPGGIVRDQSHIYEAPPLELNQWALTGDWTVGDQPAVSNEANGGIRHRFHARDVNLVMGAQKNGSSVRFRVTLDGEPPSAAAGLDVERDGGGNVEEARLYQLIRQDGPISHRSFEITFLDPGAVAYVFTFG